MSRLAFILIIALTQTALAAKPLDAIVAVVNDDIITQQEVQKELARVTQHAQQQKMTLPPKTQLKQGVINHLIDNKLQLQKAALLKIKVEAHEVEAAIADIAKRSHKTLPELKKELKKQNLSWSTYQEGVKNEMIIARAQQAELKREINLSDSAVKAFLKQHKQPTTYQVTDTLFAFSESASPEEKNHQLSLAKTYAKEPTAANSAQASTQDLGWRSREQLPLLFADAITHLKPHEYSQPLRAANGYHVLHLLAVKVSQQSKALFERAKQALFMQQMAKAKHKWIKQLRKAAYIKINAHNA